MDKILDFLNDIDTKILWGIWTLVFIAGVYLYFTIRSGFFQVRSFGMIMKNTIGKMFEKGDKNNAGMTPFQATSTALASTVGMGSIAGVAVALSVGGPGAIFWMWMLALFGMMTKAAEITLAVHYRDIDKDGNIHGGPMYYIKKGLGWKTLAKVFSAGIFINAVFCASLLQSHTVGRSFLESYGISPYVVTAVMAIITAIVVIGGIKRIGKVCEKLVPLMSLVYVLAGLIVFIVNFSNIPEVFGQIFKYAFSPMPAIGGVAGTAVLKSIQIGMNKGMLGNEAGIGTAPMVHATSNAKHPYQQGMWGAFEVFFVTFVICTITSFAVLSTGVLSGGESGVELVLQAFSSVFPKNIAEIIISFSILTFCLSTQIGFFIYYETSVINVFGKGSMRYLKWFYFIPAIVFAGVADVDKLWTFAN
ncbi:alanine/glycine:cation symporter family protein, partial [Bacteroidota bacterium]